MITRRVGWTGWRYKSGSPSVVGLVLLVLMLGWRGEVWDLDDLTRHYVAWDDDDKDGMLGCWDVGQVVYGKEDDRFMGWGTNSMSTGLFVLGWGFDNGRHRHLANNDDRYAWLRISKGSSKSRRIHLDIKERKSSGREEIWLVGREA